MDSNAIATIQPFSSNLCRFADDFNTVELAYLLLILFAGHPFFVKNREGCNSEVVANSLKSDSFRALFAGNVATD